MPCHDTPVRTVSLERTLITIGIDPHKGSHTATAVDEHEAVVGELRVDADRHQRARLLEWAVDFEPRRSTEAVDDQPARLRDHDGSPAVAVGSSVGLILTASATSVRNDAAD